MKFNKADDIKNNLSLYWLQILQQQNDGQLSTWCRKPVWCPPPPISAPKKKSIIHLVHVLAASKWLLLCLSLSLSSPAVLATMWHVLFWLVWQLRCCCRFRLPRCRWPNRYYAVETVHPPWWTPGRRLCPPAHRLRSKLDSVCALNRRE